MSDAQEQTNNFDVQAQQNSNLFFMLDSVIPPLTAVFARWKRTESLNTQFRFALVLREPEC